ncbi:MAG TPA: methyltransferase domain-containing protein [Solirubrobacteraceae bacterium]|nr:methyltransferase domain-containing protein [Solirubrobacteraceae bacterium]
MSPAVSIADHWADRDVYGLIVAALERTSKPLDSLTVEDLAPVDHFHARGFPATVDLADRLPVKPGDHVLDIGCGIGGPARYFARRFGCRVSGIDITGPFVEAANKLTALLDMGDRVSIEQGDATLLPYDDGSFDGAYAQHVTMNVADRPRFFGEAWRVLKPGGFFALSEHGLGPAGSPHHPLPWSEDGTGEFLVTPSETCRLLAAAGFVDVERKDTGPEYLAGYRAALELVDRGELPPLGLHVLMGPTAPQKMRNSARNIEEGRTHPVQVVCRKPS